MKVIDVFIRKVKTSHVSLYVIEVLKRVKKITDENGNLYEVYGLNTNGRALLNGITQLLVRGEFKGDIVNLVES